MAEKDESLEKWIWTANLFRTLLHQLMAVQIRVDDMYLAAKVRSEDAKAQDADLQFVDPSRECLQSAT